MSDLRIATFNIHHGRTKGSLYSSEKLLTGISRLEADILCLQEVDFRSMRTYFSDQPKQIANHLGFHFRTARVRFFGAGFQCIGIFSRYPIVSSHEEMLPSENSHQSRKSLTCAIEFNDKQINVTTAHLHSQGSHSQPNLAAQRQLEHILPDLEEESVSLVAGDLNMDLTQVIPIAGKFGYEAPHEYATSPSKRPRRQIDWILARGCHLCDVDVSDHIVGDHRALLSNVSLD